MRLREDASGGSVWSAEKLLAPPLMASLRPKYSKMREPRRGRR